MQFPAYLVTFTEEILNGKLLFCAVLGKFPTKANFEENPLPPPIEEVGFFLCNDCIYHRCRYFKPCKLFQFKVNDKSMIWHQKRYLNCDSKNVIYVLMRNTCEWFYLTQTLTLKQRQMIVCIYIHIYIYTYIYIYIYIYVYIHLYSLYNKNIFNTLQV